METTGTDGKVVSPGWEDAARTGSPGFLVALRRQEVSWGELWVFYREHPAEPGASLALAGFFHAAMSRGYDDEGSVLDLEGPMYPQLRDWARYAAGGRGPAEPALRDSLAGLLGLGLITPLYYELVFSVFLEACLEREWARKPAGGAKRLPRWAAVVSPPVGRLTVRWPERADPHPGEDRPPRMEGLAALVEQHYAGWNRAFEEALGDEAGERFDEGGQG